MQLKVFILGIGAALLVGTIWFVASAEDGKGFVQQASAQRPEAAKEPAQPGTEAVSENEPGLGVDWPTMEGFLRQIGLNPHALLSSTLFMIATDKDMDVTVMLDGPSNNVARGTIDVAIWNPGVPDNNNETLLKLCLIVNKLAPRWHSEDMTDWLVRNFFSDATHTTSGYEVSWEVRPVLNGSWLPEDLLNSPGTKAFNKLVKRGTLRIAPVGGGRQLTQADLAEFKEFYGECQAWVRNERGGPGLGLDIASLKVRLSRIDEGFTYKALGRGVTCATSSDGVQVFLVESSGKISAALVRKLYTVGTRTTDAEGWMQTFHRVVLSLTPRWGTRELEEYSKWFDADAEMSTTSISGYRLVSRFHRYKNDFLKDAHCDWVVGVASQAGRSSADD